jgi:hypothetical protein
MIKKIEKRLMIPLKDVTDDKIEEVVNQEILRAEEVMGQPVGKCVNVRRDPDNPDTMLVDLEITPVPMRTVWWCWDCGQPSYLALSDVIDKCFCGSSNLHDRKRTALDALKEAGDETGS